MAANYLLPPVDLLQAPDPTAKSTQSKQELEANARLIQQTLAQFGIGVSLGDITEGATITRYELHPAPGVQLERILELSRNLTAALKAESIFVLAPVPGKGSVGIEVPNGVRTKVFLRESFDSDEWRASQACLPIALGQDVYGRTIVADLAALPHCVIAGCAGSGISSGLNAIIASLLYRFRPDQLRFVLLDPGNIKLQQYNPLAHLAMPVVTKPEKILLALRWVRHEIEKRFHLFAHCGVKNIEAYNQRPPDQLLPQPAPLHPRENLAQSGVGLASKVDAGIVAPGREEVFIPEKLARIVVILSELADLMAIAPADFEMAIVHITQMGPAAGIHCIIATQRPDVSILTGCIKANIPARIAFKVACRVHSRTILDAMGAEKLLGQGDLLYLPPDSVKLVRAQGAWVTDAEIQRMVDFIASRGGCD